MASKSLYNEEKEEVDAEVAGAKDDSIQELLLSQPTASTSKSTEDVSPEVSSMQAENKCESGVECEDDTAPELSFLNQYNACHLPLLHAFRFLKLQDLLRVRSVCKVWNTVASSKILWRAVNMKNLRITDWAGFKNALKKHGTKSLDLKYMALPNNREPNIMWANFCHAVKDLPELIKISFGPCTFTAVEQTAQNCPQLEHLFASSVEGYEIDLTNIANCKNLSELKLIAHGKIRIKNCWTLQNLKSLSVLSITSFSNIREISAGICQNLTVLELGDCVELNEDFTLRTLPRLVNLQKLRLENGSARCSTEMFFNEVSKLPNIKQLEIINFCIHPGCELSMAKCTNLETLLIVPIYDEESYKTCYTVLSGVIPLALNLKNFIWGFTLELLRITGLACRDPGYGNGNAERIPMMKENGDQPDDGYLIGTITFTTLRKLFADNLPDTKVKLLQVPLMFTCFLKA